jgi:hypothetical protein
MAFHCREMVVSLICRCPNRVKTHQVLGARCHFSAVEVEKKLDADLKTRAGGGDRLGNKVRRWAKWGGT